MMYRIPTMPRWMECIWHETYKYLLNRFAKAVKEYNGCKTIVETGIWSGESAIELISGSECEVYFGYDKDPKPEVYDNLEKYKEKIVLTKINTFDLKEFPIADLYHIDGDHTKEGCLNDLKLAEENMKEKSVILVHDIFNLKEVMEAVDEWYKGKENIFNRQDIRITKGWAILWKK